MKSFDHRSMKIFFTSVICLLTVFSTRAQVVSSGGGTGDWNDPNSWSPAVVPSAASGTITIQAFHTITVSDVQQADELTVQGDGTLIISNGGQLTLADGTGDDLTIEIGDGFFTSDGIVTVQSGGTLVNQGQISSTSSNLLINGIYQHSLNGGIIPTATWGTGSLTNITGITNTKPSGLSQSFYNFTWNSAQTGTISLLGELTSIANDMTVSNTGGRPFILATTGGTSTNIGRDLNIQNSSTFAISQSGTFTLNVGRDLLINSTSGNSLLSTATGTVIINVTGDMIKSNIGTMNFASSSGTTTLNLEGDLDITDGTITETSSGSGTINFTGTSLQTFTNTGTLANTINFTVDNNAIVDLGTAALTGSGNFTANTGSDIRLGSTNSSGAISGNIQITGSKTFNDGVTLTYNGSSAQFIGANHPSNNVSTVVNNANGVTLASNVVFGGDIILTSGNLAVNGNTITINAGLTANSNNILVGTGSSIVLNGSGAFGTFPFSSGAHTFTSFTLNRTSGSVTFANDITLTGVLDLSAGDLIFDNQTLTLDGTVTGVGSLSASSASISNLQIGGTGALGTIRFNASNNTLDNLTITRTSSGNVTLTGTLNIVTGLNLNNGTLDNSGGTINMSNGSTVTKNSAATFTGNPLETINGDTYNVTYEGGSQTTGAEIPSAVETEVLGTLTINTSAPVTLDQALQVNGDVILNNGSLSIGSNTLTVKGNWQRNSGSLAAYTGLIIFDGSTVVSGTGSPSFNNIQVTGTATVSFPSDLINLAGDLQIDAGAVFSPGGGTIILNGSVDQTLTVGGATLNNITINKSAGVVDITSPLNLQGRMRFQTATTVNSSGNLTVVSTSDGTSGNGSIGVIPSGATINGDVTVQRYMSGEGRIYRYLSSSVSNATVASWQDDFPITGTFSDPSTGSGINSTNPSLYYYDESLTGDSQSGWLPYPTSGNAADNSLVVGRGYAAFIREGSASTTVDVSGPINMGAVSFSVTYNNTGDASADGWNLVGNPYPSSIDWDAASGAWTKTNISSQIAVKDNGSGGVFQYWDGSTGGLSNGEIAMGQAFWVRATSAGPSLGINEQAKTSATGALYRNSREVLEQLIVSLSNGTYVDRAYIVLNEEATLGFDNLKDTPKLNNDIFDLSTYGDDSVSLAINYIDDIGCGQNINLRLADVNPGSYTLQFEGMASFLVSYDLILIDNYLNIEHDINVADSYTFNVTSDAGSFGNDRFKIAFKADLIDASLKLDGPSLTCGESVEIRVSDSQVGVTYQLLLNGNPILDPSTGNGADLLFTVPSGNFGFSENNITVIASVSGCNDKILDNSISVSRENITPEISVESGVLVSNYDEGNQWLLNGTIIEGATSKTYEPFISGEYSLRVSKNGCEGEVNKEFFVTGMEPEEWHALVIYPVPATDEITIRRSETFTGKTVQNLQVYNSKGENILSARVNLNKSIKLDISNWPSGVYLMKFSEGNNIFVRRLVKQ